VWTVIAAVIATTACTGSGCKRDRNSPGDPNAPAGVVVELAGEVTARRAATGTEFRPLAVEAQVFADDTITTGAGASVAIRLRHNNAVWNLGPDKARRVDGSVAWGAAATSADPLAQTSTDPSASAGRHVEVEAAGDDTSPNTGTATTDEPGAENEARAGGDDNDGDGDKDNDKGSNQDRPDLSDKLREEISGAVRIVGVRGNEADRRVIASSRERIANCYRQVLRTDEKAGGRVVIRMATDETGKVIEVEIVSGGRLEAMNECLETKMKLLVFPGGSAKKVHATFILSP
jgi:hypothetical protein